MKSVHPNIVCFHGFLGDPQDWEFLRKPLQDNGANLYLINLWESFEAAQPDSMVEWSEFLTQSLRNLGVDFNQTLALGYSMGGRLLAQMLTNPKCRFTKAVLIGAHLGLPNLEDRALRLRQDELWASRFLTEEWSSVIAAWNAQDVFKGSVLPTREDLQNRRQTLARVLTVASLGRQEYLLPALREVPALELVAGSLDYKFSSLYQTWALEWPNVKVTLVPRSGHRVLWDRPQALVEYVLKELKTKKELSDGKMANP